MKTLKIAGVLLLFLGIGLFNQSHAQTVIWTFDAADNSGWIVQITSNGSGEVTKFEFGKKGEQGWRAATIEFQDDYGTYFRVKSVSSGKVYEYAIDWTSDKMIETSPDGKQATYWLRKS